MISKEVEKEKKCKCWMFCFYDKKHFRVVMTRIPFLYRSCSVISYLSCVNPAYTKLSENSEPLVKLASKHLTGSKSHLNVTFYWVSFRHSLIDESATNFHISEIRLIQMKICTIQIISFLHFWSKQKVS